MKKGNGLFPFFLCNYETSITKFAAQLVPVCREMDHYKQVITKSGQAIEYLYKSTIIMR